MKAERLTAWEGTRPLLRNLREVLKEGGERQLILDRIVALIADNMVAEVCSLYLKRAGEVLELFATKGLRQEAVHMTRLRVGEGIIGVIASTAKSLALAEAQDHPSFAFRPETGEDLYHSMMGVPLMRDARVLGVLTVQNKRARTYSEEEIEALETVAMVLCELIASHHFISEEEGRLADSETAMPSRMVAVALSEGIGMGPAVFHQRGVVIRHIVADDSQHELTRLKEALDDMHLHLESLQSHRDLQSLAETQDILESYKLFSQDQGWLDKIRERILSGLTAEAATHQVMEDIRAKMLRMRDDYLKERLADFQDLGHKLLLHLNKREVPGPSRELPDRFVLVATSLGPAELLEYDRASLQAIVLEEGSPASHVSIIARALNIPVLGQCKDIHARLHEGDYVIVDCINSQVFLRPRQSVRHSYDSNIEARRVREIGYESFKHLPANSRDGIDITTLMNAGLLADMAGFANSGAQGVGLYRTEVPFMVNESFPDIATQTDLYQKILHYAGDKPVTFRTLDIGGDKILPYWNSSQDENPVMGWRAMRISLDRPMLLRHQLTAMIRATAGRQLKVMFPMITEVYELQRAKSILYKILAAHTRRGEEPPTQVQIGVMLEVPALLWQLPALVKEADFISIGSNDLLQFFFASDRGNPSLSRRYDVLSPPVIALFRQITTQMRQTNTTLTICGEIAGLPLEAMFLIGCGFRSLSMTASGIGPVKNMIRSLDVKELEGYISYLQDLSCHSLRGRLHAYAKDTGIIV